MTVVCLGILGGWSWFHWNQHIQWNMHCPNGLCRWTSGKPL